MSNGYLEIATRIPKTKPEIAGKVFVGRVGSEFVSGAAFFGSLIFAEALLPKQVETAKHWVGKHIVAPHLDQFDKAADAFPALEGPEGTEERKHMSREQKIELFAGTIVDYSIKGTAGRAAQTLAQRYFDKPLGLPSHDVKLSRYVMSATKDATAQIGAFALMNTAGYKTNIKMQKDFSGFCQKHFGMGEETAETFSRDIINMQIPNFVGMLTATHSLTKDYSDKLLPPKGTGR